MKIHEPVINTRRIVIGAFFLLNFVLLFCLADRNGYEGDDLNSIAPMFHLSEAKRGDLEIYRYHWQPLSYEIGAAVYRISGDPEAIFLLAPVAAAISLAMFLSICWPQPSSSSGLFAAMVALLALPESWFSGLYYNSTILGLPFLLGAFSILMRRGESVFTALGAVLACLAILMRIDYALVVPGLMFVAWRAHRSISRPALFAAIVVAILAIAVLTGLLKLDRIWESYRAASGELAVRAAEPGWDLRTKLSVISTVFSPIGWVIIAIGGPLVLLHSVRRAPTEAAMVAVAVAPLVLPMKNLLSVKYALPFFVFLAVFLTQCVLSIEKAMSASFRNAVRFVLALGTAVLIFVSVSVYGKMPYLVFGTLASRPIETHDGPRSYGGYFWQMVAVELHAAPQEQETRARELFNDLHNAAGPDVVMVGEESYFSAGAVGWRHLQVMLEQAGYRGKLVAPHRLQFDIGPRRLTLLREIADKRDLTPFDRGKGVTLFDLRGSREERR